MTKSKLHLLLLALLFALPTWAKPVNRAVVVGGGPAGLTAAITLRQMGKEVLVLEARSQEYSREFHLGLRIDTVQVLDEIGALDLVAERAGYSQAEVDNLRASYLSGPREDLAMLTDDSALVTRISDLEKLLYQRATELGVEYRPHCTIDFSHWPESWAQKGSTDIAGGFHPEGEPTPLGEVDLIVAAEGIRSPTRQHLGIDFKPEGPYTWFTGILWEKQSPVRYQRWVRDKPGGFRQKIVSLGHKRYPQTWTLVELEPKAAGMKREERTAYACAQISEVFGVELPADKVIWGGLFSRVQNRRSERVVDGKVVIVGEAARAGLAWSSAGVNLAMVSDRRSLTRLVQELDGDVPDAYSHFESSVQAASSAWLTLDISDFAEKPTH